MRETFLIVDGNSLMHRAFHALPLMDADGVYTNAVHGFLSMLLKSVEEQNAAYCAVAFDEHGPTFRHARYEAYKAGRRETPEELRGQFPVIREILCAMRLGVLSLPGFEADDLLGTLARLAGERELRALLLTGDRDALQLVGGNTELLFTRRGISETTRFDAPTVKEYFGVTPGQVTDWKGLMGDASDNIPGVPGVGEKTAVKLLGEYGTLENVLAHAGEVKGKLGEKLQTYAEQARFSKELATIRTDAPVALALSDWRTDRMAEGAQALRKYKLNGILSRLSKGAPPVPAAPAAAEQAFTQITALSDIAALPGRLAPGPAALYLGDQEESAVTIAQDGRRFRVSLGGDLLTPGVTPGEALRALAPLWENRPLIVHDGKRLLHTLARMELPPARFAWDTLLGAYLINPQEKSFSLHALAGAQDAGALLALAARQRERLAADGMTALMEQLELPLLYVLFDMEREGFLADGGVLAQLGAQFTARIEELREDIYALSGVRGFNINSPQQLGKVLFETLGLRTGKKTLKGYSTDAETLEKLLDEHPVIEKVLSYRQLVKLQGTYIEGLTRLMGRDGRIHTTFDQTGTATGRISSSEPNLQNIPVRTPLGREIRRAFIAKPGCVLVDADYSQIELRILAHLSGDPAMCDAFRKGQDIHTRTAAEVYGVPMEQVTPAMRSSAKAVNFGLVYGISDFGLSRNTGVTRGEAAAFIQRYFQRYPGVKRFMEDAVANGAARGYCQTLMGRRRQLTELTQGRGSLKKFGERVAMNTPVQGTAADIIKLAMVRVHEALRAGGFAARLILQVHDELLIECPEQEAARVGELLRGHMENVCALDVPLVADVKSGRSWYETK